MENVKVDDQAMDARLTALENDLATVKTDVAIIRSNYATKVDLQKVEAEVAAIRSNYATKQDLQRVEADVAVIRSNYVTKEELQKEMQALTWKLFGFCSVLVGLVFTIAKNVH